MDLKLSIPDKIKNIEVSTKDQKSNRKSIVDKESMNARKVLEDKDGHETLLAIDMSVVKKSEDRAKKES